MLKWIVRIVAAFIVVPALVIGVYSAVNWLSLRPNAAVVAYLQKNAHAVDLSAPAPFTFDDAFRGKRVILLGEVHGMAIGQSLDFALLRQLNAETGARFYLAEIDLAQAAAFNAYLDSGDEALLKPVFAFWLSQSAQWANADFVEKIRKIRALNMTLPAERRIRFIGMDRVQEMAPMADYVARLAEPVTEAAWPGKDAFLAVLGDAEARASSDPASKIPAAAVEASKSFPAAAPEGVDPQRFRELKEALTRLVERATLQNREPLIAAAMTRLLGDEGYTGEKFYGFWGLFHVINAKVSGAEPLAYLLQKDGSPFAGSIGSIAVINLDSKMLMPGGAFGAKTQYVDLPYSLDHPLIGFSKGVGDLKAAAVAPYTLFRLDAEGSPYPGTNRLGVVGGLFGLMQKFEVDPKTVGPSGAMQYVVLAKGSAAVKALTPQDVAAR